MNRLSGTLRLDIRLQWLHGFYYAAGVMLVLFLLLLSELPQDNLQSLLPAIMINNIIMNGFFFVAGLVQLEKDEGSLYAQVVTPLHPLEYLSSKALSLALLSLVENVLLALLLIGNGMSVVWLLPGIVTGTVFFVLSGFLLVARYETLYECLLPSFLAVAVLALPLLPYLGAGDSGMWLRLVYAHPLQAILLALRAGMGVPLSPWQRAYALLYPAIWTIILLGRAKAVYARHVRKTTSLPDRRKS